MNLPGLPATHEKSAKWCGQASQTAVQLAASEKQHYPDSKLELETDVDSTVGQVLSSLCIPPPPPTLQNWVITQTYPRQAQLLAPTWPAHGLYFPVFPQLN